jgi:hypothetical protein
MSDVHRFRLRGFVSVILSRFVVISDFKKTRSFPFVTLLCFSMFTHFLVVRFVFLEIVHFFSFFVDALSAQQGLE